MKKPSFAVHPLWVAFCFLLVILTQCRGQDCSWRVATSGSAVISTGVLTVYKNWGATSKQISIANDTPSGSSMVWSPLFVSPAFVGRTSTSGFGSLYTLAPGASVVKMTSFSSTIAPAQSAQLGMHTGTLTTMWKIGAGGTPTAAVGTRTALFTAAAVSGGVPVLPTVGLTCPAGIPAYDGGTTSGTEMIWCTVDIDMPAATGTYTVHGVPGTVKIDLRIDGIEVATAKQVVATTLFPSLSVMPDVVWTTTNPLPYHGKQYQTFVNGMPVHPPRTIETGAVGVSMHPDNSFEILVNWSADWSYPDFDPNLPEANTAGAAAGTDSGNGLDDAPPAQVGDRPEPPAITGPDPAGDATVDSDGAGPGAGLSVKDVYRATRAAMQDAIGPAGPVENLDPQKMIGNPMDVLDPAVIQTANSMGGLASGLGGAMLAESMTVPGLDGSTVFGITTPWGFYPVPVFSWAPVLRGFLSALIWIIYFRAVVSVVRRAFTS